MHKGRSGLLLAVFLLLSTVDGFLSRAVHSGRMKRSSSSSSGTSADHEGSSEPPMKQSHVVGTPRETQDPAFSLLRRGALEEQLASLGIEGLESDAELAGSPALKTFNSFINPRADKLHIAKAENMATAATRTANQIAALVRQRRAERADWLRNKDRAASARADAGLELQPLVLVLDNVRSAYNVGSILRTAETAGVAEVICCGLTPCPPHDKVRKTAFDAAEAVPTRHFPSTAAALEDLRRNGLGGVGGGGGSGGSGEGSGGREGGNGSGGAADAKADAKAGWTVYGMETTSKSLSYTSVQFPKNTVLVLGNEVTGIDTAIMDACDALVEIPTYGMKNSLNVASAAPVVIFEVLRQWGATTRPSSDL